MRPILFIAVLCAIFPANPSAFQLAAAPPAAVGPSPSDSPERLFAWFDSLGYPDVSRARFVRVRSGNAALVREFEPEYEFLLADHDNAFTTLSLIRLTTRTLLKMPAKGGQTDWFTFEAEDLAGYIDGQLHYAAALLAQGLPCDHRPLEEPVGLRGQLFVLARAAHARRLAEPAAKLLDLVARLPDPYWLDDFKNRHVKERLANDFAYAETWHALRMFGYKDADYPQTLAKLERIETLFPQFDRHAELSDAIGRFRRMIRRDEARRQRPDDRPLESRSRREQIDEWIYRLREVDRFQDTFSYYGGAADSRESPVHRLAGFGLDAATQLIGAIEDDGFVRCFHSTAGVELIWPPTIGQAAETALGYIAGRSFELPDGASDALPAADQRAAVRKRAQVWYADVRARGVKAVLIDGARCGEDHSPHQAARLALLYPADAAAPILEGAAKARGPSLRSAMIRELADVPGDGIRPFLLGEAESGPTLASALAAAAVLKKQGVNEVVPIIVRRWHDFTRLPEHTLLWSADVDGERGTRGEYDCGAREFAEFLLQSGEPQWIRALASGMHRLEITERAKVVRDTGELLLNLLCPGKEPAPASIDSVYHLLLTALDDDRERSDKLILDRYREPFRICDLAATHLREFDTAENPFDVRDDQPARDRSLADIRIALRRRLGLPPVEPGRRLPTMVTPD